MPNCSHNTMISVINIITPIAMYDIKFVAKLLECTYGSAAQSNRSSEFQWSDFTAVVSFLNNFPHFKSSYLGSSVTTVSPLMTMQLTLLQCYCNANEHYSNVIFRSVIFYFLFQGNQNGIHQCVITLNQLVRNTIS